MVVFCGTFEASGLSVRAGNGQLRIDRDGRIPKFVEKVREVTFCGPSAVRQGKSVLYVTERAVFRLTKDGPTLIEVAPGIDLQRQVLDRMAFRPVVAPEVGRMTADCFVAAVAEGNGPLAKAEGSASV